MAVPIRINGDGGAQSLFEIDANSCTSLGATAERERNRQNLGWTPGIRGKGLQNDVTTSAVPICTVVAEDGSHWRHVDPVERIA